MTQLDLTFEEAKQKFFDRRAVEKALDKGAREAMTRIGGYVRTTAKRSMRKPGKSKRTRTSQPGKPPRRHTGVLRDRIFFVYDENKKAVVIGPLKWTAPKSKLKPTGGAKSAASVLEHGGWVTGQTNQKTNTKGKYLKGQQRSIYIEPRPYMGPALEKARASGDMLRHFRHMLKK